MEEISLFNSLNLYNSPLSHPIFISLALPLSHPIFLSLTLSLSLAHTLSFYPSITLSLALHPLSCSLPLFLTLISLSFCFSPSVLFHPSLSPSPSLCLSPLLIQVEFEFIQSSSAAGVFTSYQMWGLRLPCCPRQHCQRGLGKAVRSIA